jgi:hypothetical protein
MHHNLSVRLTLNFPIGSATTEYKHSLLIISELNRLQFQGTDLSDLYMVFAAYLN